jgi:hypothetical protein
LNCVDLEQHRLTNLRLNERVLLRIQAMITWITLPITINQNHLPEMPGPPLDRMSVRFDHATTTTPHPNHERDHCGVEIVGDDTALRTVGVAEGYSR